jgi:hypothetical protein
MIGYQGTPQITQKASRSNRKGCAFKDAHPDLQSQPTFLSATGIKR